MSARQVKKIVNKVQNTAKADSEDSSDELPDVKKNRFGTFDMSDEEDEYQDSPEEDEPVVQVSTKIETKKKVKQDILEVEGLIEVSPPEEEKKEQVLESCLKREAKYFDSENELQKLFQEKKTKSKSRSRQKTFILTPSIIKQSNIKVNYLPTMEKTQDKYHFEMTKGYLKLHSEYLFCVESNDPGMLHEFSFKHPLHIESLYQLALLYKLQSKYEQVYQFIERILYAFQLSFHHQFSPIGKDVQMDLASSMLTKVFFKSIFLFIDCLGRKGCYRTALEFSKFLLALDTRDPLGALFLVDYYALSTKNYEFFVMFSAGFLNEFRGRKSVLDLPSALYSLALAKALAGGKWNVEQKDVDRAFEINDLGRLGEEEPAVVLLCAVASFPLIAKALLQRVAPSFEFLYAEGCDWDYELIQKIYINRNLELWRSESAVNWLKQASDEAEIVGPKNFNNIYIYENLDPEDFSFSSRAVIPADMAFK